MNTSWWLCQGTGEVLDPDERDRRWPPPPPWRTFAGGPDQPPPPLADPSAARHLGPASAAAVPADPQVVTQINAALYLRRPLLLTGPPGTGKSSLAYQVARELGLGRVLGWPVTSRSTVASGLYELVGDTVHLGPLGTALLPYRLPRVLLVDELDNGDLDLPHDLRHVLAAGGFTIRELTGTSQQRQVRTADPGGVAAVPAGGQVRCHEPPFVVVTSTDVRDLPESFARCCVHARLPAPDEAPLAAQVAAHFPEQAEQARTIVAEALHRRPGLAAAHLRDLVALRLAVPDGGDELWDAV